MPATSATRKHSFTGGKSFYTQTVDAALAEIDRLPGRHLYFLDDHLFGHPQFAAALFDGMTGMDRLWQAAATVKSILMPGLLEKAVQSGLRSLFVGFETLSPHNLRAQHKYQNLNRDYHAADPPPARSGRDGQRQLCLRHGRRRRDGVRSHGGVGHSTGHRDGHLSHPHALSRHGLQQRLADQGRITSNNWDLYDTRHVVFQPARLSPEKLEAGYWQAYRDFYRWGSIFKSAAAHARPIDQLRHIAYAGGWKKFEPLWDAVIRAKRVSQTLPLLENILAGFGKRDYPTSSGCPAGNRARSVVCASCKTLSGADMLFPSSTQVQQVQHAEPSFCAAFPVR